MKRQQKTVRNWHFVVENKVEIKQNQKIRFEYRLGTWQNKSSSLKIFTVSDELTLYIYWKSNDHGYISILYFISMIHLFTVNILCIASISSRHILHIYTNFSRKDYCLLIFSIFRILCQPRNRYIQSSILRLRLLLDFACIEFNHLSFF